MSGASDSKDTDGMQSGYPEALDSFAREARKAFPWIEAPEEKDSLVVSAQLGREVRGCIFVAGRCPHGRPAVILTVPYEAGGGPAAPLLWLTCPDMSRAVSGLESDGTMRRFKEALETNGETEALFMEDEERFSRIQAGLAAIRGEAVRERLGLRGAAGGPIGAVKCLHAHLAYRLAGGRSVLGDWCLGELAKRSGFWCERVPETCIG